MYKYFAIIFAAAVLYSGCGKKEDPSVKYDNKNQQNTQQNSQNQQQQSNQTQQKPQESFAVKTVGESAGKNQMVDFTWTEDGKEKKLSDYKGKVILLNFWATWCPPCKKELPALSQISTELKDKDFKMIGVSVDDNMEVLNTFLKSNSLSYTIVFEPNQLVTKYMNATGQNQNVVPQTYLIDKNGKVVETILGARSKQDFLDLINKYL
jgi:peroxiredoxin